MVMSVRDKKMVRDDGDSDDINPHMPHLPLLSSGESEISPHFRHVVESLSDSDDESSKSQSDDDSFKSCPSTSSTSLYKSRNYGSTSSVSIEDTTAQCSKSKKRNILCNNDEDELPMKKKRKFENGEASDKSVISSAAQKMMVN